MKKKRILCALIPLVLLAGCAESTAAEEISETSESDTETITEDESSAVLTEYSDSGSGTHAIEADGETISLENIKVTKTGDSEDDEADFYGENAAVLAHEGASLTIAGAVIETDGKHANAVFSYGTGTEVTVSDSSIHTSGNCSGGLMTTGGGTMTANSLTVVTEGNSSAAIRSDRGGGTVIINGGSYESHGKGSPAIYSTADITVNDAELISTSAQGVVVEGKNSVTLNNVTLQADNTTKNSNKSDRYQAVKLYQSMSGDADEGTASFTMKGGSLINLNGSVFFVTNTSAVINLSDAEIENDSDFMNIEAAGWGNDGANGGHVTLNADCQTFQGDITVDSISSLDMTLTGGSSYSGAIISSGETNVTLESGSSWVLTGDSSITSLGGDTSGIDLNGFSLSVNGVLFS